VIGVHHQLDDSRIFDAYFLIQWHIRREKQRNTKISEMEMQHLHPIFDFLADYLPTTKSRISF
jgi:hypothetical protein